MHEMHQNTKWWWQINVTMRHECLLCCSLLFITLNEIAKDVSTFTLFRCLRVMFECEPCWAMQISQYLIKNLKLILIHNIVQHTLLHTVNCIVYSVNLNRDGYTWIHWLVSTEKLHAAPTRNDDDGYMKSSHSSTATSVYFH